MILGLASRYKLGCGPHNTSSDSPTFCSHYEQQFSSACWPPPTHTQRKSVCKILLSMLGVPLCRLKFLGYVSLDDLILPIQQSPITGAEKLVYARAQATLPTPSSPIEGSITPRFPAPTKDWQCHLCSDSFCRWQDRDRHEQTHLPYFMHCPLPHCEWRGNRTHTFKTHWHKKDHRPYHQIYGNAPKRSQIETYDPRPILNRLRSGRISLSEAEDQAIFSVMVKGYELQKPSMWLNAQGRGKRWR